MKYKPSNHNVYDKNISAKAAGKMWISPEGDS